MNSSTKKLEIINASIEGVIASCFVGYDGLIIDSVGTYGDLGIDLTGATFASVIKILKNETNEAVELIVTFKKDLILVRIMEDGFICVIMSRDANIGRAKLATKNFGTKFLEVL